MVNKWFQTLLNEQTDGELHTVSARLWRPHTLVNLVCFVNLVCLFICVFCLNCLNYILFCCCWQPTYLDKCCLWICWFFVVKNHVSMMLATVTEILYWRENFLPHVIEPWKYLYGMKVVCVCRNNCWNVSSNLDALKCDWNRNQKNRKHSHA